MSDQHPGRDEHIIVGSTDHGLGLLCSVSKELGKLPIGSQAARAYHLLNCKPGGMILLVVSHPFSLNHVNHQDVVTRFCSVFSNHEDCAYVLMQHRDTHPRASQKLATSCTPTQQTQEQYGQPRRFSVGVHVVSVLYRSGQFSQAKCAVVNRKFVSSGLSD